MNKTGLMMAVILIFLSLVPNRAWSDQETAEPSWERPWSISAFYGIFSRKDLSKMALELPTGKQAYTRYVLAASVSRTLFRWKKHFYLEAEALVVKHYMRYDPKEFEEFVIDFPLRVRHFPWDEYVRTTLAIGEGMSYCTKRPPNPDQGYENPDPKLLNYLMFEISLGVPAFPQADLFMRIHHRSGIFGLMGHPDVGANYYAYGLRVNF